MGRIPFFALAFGLALTALAPAGAAFHGGTYEAFGTATRDGTTYEAKLTWTPMGLGVAGTFRLELTDPETGLALPRLQLPGREYFSNVRIEPGPGCALFEVFDYRAVAAVGPLELPALFEVEGEQRSDLCAGIKSGRLAGPFVDFRLELVVDFHLV